METSSAFLYAELADKLESQILDGVFRAGEKLPSIRTLHAQTGLSVSTVYQSFIELEKRGMVEPRQKSGYFVKPLLQDLLPAPKTPDPHAVPRKININNLAFALIEAMGDPEVLQLGGALVSSELLPLKEIGRLFKSTSLSFMGANLAAYEHYAGHPDLRRQIAQRMTPYCSGIAPRDVVITNGCIEAVTLCLDSITRTGDTVLVESPTFPWFLQLISKVL